MNKKGILLVNLGTPDEPSPQAVKRYLLEFLSDQRVIDYPKWLWQFILRGIILNVRPKKVAQAYQSIWLDEGSPLRVYSQAQVDAVAAQFKSESLAYPVEMGMTYGNPSISAAVDKLLDKGVNDIVVLPLYPQYSATTTAAVFDVLANDFKKRRVLPALRFINSYCQDPAYIQVLAQSIRDFWQAQGSQNTLLFSFHGIPKRYVTLGDPYQSECEKTAQLVAQSLGLNDDQWMLCYQSRVGKEEWLQPYTDKTLELLPGKGIKQLDVICPAFSVDCLETLEEMAVENKEIFVEAGGTEYRYIPALNANTDHINYLVDLLKRNM